MRLIDADELKKWIQQMIAHLTALCKLTDLASLRKTFEVAIKTYHAALELVDEMPVVDAVPVVRCKDCQERCPNSGVSVQHCTLSGIQTEDDDYCSWGKRREDEA